MAHEHTYVDLVVRHGPQQVNADGDTVVGDRWWSLEEHCPCGAVIVSFVNLTDP